MPALKLRSVQVCWNNLMSSVQWQKIWLDGRLLHILRRRPEELEGCAGGPAGSRTYLHVLENSQAPPQQRADHQAIVREAPLRSSRLISLSPNTCGKTQVMRLTQHHVHCIHRSQPSVPSLHRMHDQKHSMIHWFATLRLGKEQ